MTGRILCGQPLGDDVTCRNTAPCVVHRERDLSPAADIPASNPAPGLEAAIENTAAVITVWEHTHPDGVPWTHLIGESCDLPSPDEPLDLHQALKDDTQAWSVRSRLTKSLGRPALATRLADALPPLLGAELADRLDTLITQALTEQQAQITQELSDSYYAARARLDADAAAKLKELRNERHRGVSRFS